MKSFYTNSEILRIFNYIWVIHISENREKYQIYFNFMIDLRQQLKKTAKKLQAGMIENVQFYFLQLIKIEKLTKIILIMINAFWSCCSSEKEISTCEVQFQVSKFEYQVHECIFWGTLFDNRVFCLFVLY